MPAGEEREFDLVQMSGIVGKGAAARAVPWHCGCLVRPGLMMDIEENNGALVRELTHPNVVKRVLGTYRPVALA